MPGQWNHALEKQSKPPAAAITCRLYALNGMGTSCQVPRPESHNSKVEDTKTVRDLILY